MSALLLHLIQAAAISVYGSLHLFPDFHCSCTIFCRPMSLPPICLLFQFFCAFGVCCLGTEEAKTSDKADFVVDCSQDSMRRHCCVLRWNPDITPQFLVASDEAG
ncbi:hypothetical protein SCA6_017919 [Theobroma cacao]